MYGMVLHRRSIPTRILLRVLKSFTRKQAVREGSRTGGPGARHVRGEGPKTDHAIAVAHEILGQPEVISINNSALLHSWQPLRLLAWHGL